MVLYVAVWLYGARREAGQGVAPVWSEIQLNTAEFHTAGHTANLGCMRIQPHPVASAGGIRHTEKTGGGGLEPSAANPDYWDLVPYTENKRSKRAQLPGGRRSSYAQLNTLREESPQRAQIEQAEAAKIADSPGH